MPTGIIIKPTKLKHRVLLFLLTSCGENFNSESKSGLSKIFCYKKRKKTGNVLAYCAYK